MTRDDDPELIAIRPEERLETTRLEPYLRERLPATNGPLDVRQFGGGHANLTYLVAFGEHEYVLRRPPLGPVAASAHDMRREHRVLRDLWRAFALAPRSYLFCDDDAVIGAPFQVMERRYGIVVRADVPPPVEDTARNRRIGEMLIDTLAALHAVEPAAVGLDDLGKPDGYVERQLAGWTDRWMRAETPSRPDARDLLAWLDAHRPQSRDVTLVHNDFKLDNVLVDAGDAARAVAVLDWDMCTRGDPLMDLGYLLALWPQADDPPVWRTGSMPMPTWRAGFPSRETAAARYAATTGRDVSAILWYQVFNWFRFAVILQQIYVRFVRGQTSDERFANFDRRVAGLIDLARFSL